MYMRFFGLKQEPFSLAPDPRYLYMSKRHREALAHLLYGVGGGGGFVLLSGEIGAGTTTVCRCFLEQIPKRTNVAYIFNPKLTVIELLKAICDEFRVPWQPPAGGAAPTVRSYVDPLNEFLLKTHAVGQNNVLIIDEAQMLSVDVLEQLRLLTNLETNERKLLQIVLIGQPELRQLLERPELEQLAQRVIARFHLKALSSKETEHYIRHRLSVAGMTRQIPFDRAAIQRVHEISRGVPRRINLLCDRAMLGAYAHGRPGIDVATVEKAAREVFGKSEPLHPDRSQAGSRAGFGIAIATGVALAALLVFAVWGVWRRHDAPEAAATASAVASAPASASVAASAASRSAATSPASAPASASSAAGMASAAESASAASAPVAAAPEPTAPASSPPATAATVGAGAPLDASGLQASLKTIGRDERSAWDDLAPLWGVSAAPGDACAASAKQQVRCYRFSTTFATVRALDRPGFLTLRDASGGTTHVVLVGLDGDTALLRDRDGTVAVRLAGLTKAWQGEFGTLWKLPPGYTGALIEGAGGALVDRLAGGLAKMAGESAPPSGATMDAALRSKVSRFQSAHGLSPVGKAGPTTFMQFNRATGVDEPRLVAVSAR